MQHPSTPETLMRSRYTAYTLADIAYIKKTMRGKALQNFDAIQAKIWAKKVIWLGLEVRQSGLNNPKEGYVEFVARFMDGAHLNTLHEKSRFLFQQGRWFYVDGILSSD